MKDCEESRRKKTELNPKCPKYLPCDAAGNDMRVDIERARSLHVPLNAIFNISVCSIKLNAGEDFFNIVLP